MAELCRRCCTPVHRDPAQIPVGGTATQPRPPQHLASVSGAAQRTDWEGMLMDPRTDWDFSGRSVVVTGGTKGIGFVVATAFLEAGADVMVCGRHTPATLPHHAGRTASFRATDVRDPSDAAGLIDDTVAAHGGLDVLVNNAGGSPDADAATVSPRFVEKILALNLLAPFYAAQAANSVMQANPEGGSIINIGSVSAHDPQPGTAAYSAAKAGLLVLSPEPWLWNGRRPYASITSPRVSFAPRARPRYTATTAGQPSSTRSRWAGWPSQTTSPTPACSSRADRRHMSTVQTSPSTAVVSTPLGMSPPTAVSATARWHGKV